MKTKLITLLLCLILCSNDLLPQINSSNQLRLSPQPVYHELSIDFFNKEVDKQQDIVVNVYDLLGNLVKKQTFLSFNATKKLQIELSELSSGMYLLMVEGTVKYPTQRFIKR